MRITAILFFGILFRVSASTLAQSIVLQETKLTYKALFEEIEQQTGLITLYDNSQIDMKNEVQLSSKHLKLDEVYSQILDKKDLTYEVVDDFVVIIKDIEKNLIPIQPKQKQNKVTVTGTVTDENGNALVGVNVYEIDNLTNGVNTDMEGNYSIVIKPKGHIKFTFIGFNAQEIAIDGQTQVNVTLTEEVTDIDEVVVTALGIKRSTKALGYSVTKVDGKILKENKTLNFGTALTGKVAGVSVSTPSTGATGSSRIVIRGNSSINGSNQPLFVIDGVPMDNTQMGSPGRWGGTDWGDGLSAINSDEVESISVLKGNTAAALYGSRAQNGVILITTKSGSAGKGLGIDINSNTSFDVVIDPFQVQTKYGHGRYGAVPTTVAAAKAENKYSFGGILDGKEVPYFDGVTRPYTYNRQNLLKDFYRIGKTYNNNIAFSGGNKDHNVRVAFNINNTKPITPNSTFDRIIGSINYNGKITDKLSITLNGKYSWQEVKNRPQVGDFANNMGFVLGTLPTTMNNDLIIGDPTNPGTNVGDYKEYLLSNDVWRQNPYFAAYQFKRGDTRDRMINAVKLRYDFTDWMYIKASLGFDYWNTKTYNITPSGVGHGNSNMNEFARTNREVNKDFMIGFKKDFNKFSFNGFIGGAQMRREYESKGGEGWNFSVPNLHIMSNLKTLTYRKAYNQTGTNSAYGSAEFGYSNYLFLTMTGRQDWYSTLDGKGLFYPAVSLSALATELLKDMNVNIDESVLSFAKLRGSWAQVGGDAGSAYQTSLTYSVLGGSHNGASIAKITQGYIPSTNIKPLTNTEWEVGVDLRFLNNRFGIDFAYYNRKTTDDILYASVSTASGYGSALVNIGQVNNKGYELMINAKPLNKALKWDITFNYSKNNNEVVKLNGETTEMTAATSRTGYGAIKHIVGQPYSVVTGRVQKTINGQKVYDKNGMPVVSDDFQILGQGVHDQIVGLNNTFSYKGIHLSAQIDGQFGGSVYSASNYYMIRAGLHEMTLKGRDGLKVSGVDTNGNPQTWDIASKDLHAYYKKLTYCSENVVYDASYVKLREISLGYDFAKLLNIDVVKNLKVSFFGRNLALLYGKIPNIDPESALNSGNAQGLEMFGLPTTKTYGFNVSVKF